MMHLQAVATVATVVILVTIQVLEMILVTKMVTKTVTKTVARIPTMTRVGKTTVEIRSQRRKKVAKTTENQLKLVHSSKILVIRILNITTIYWGLPKMHRKR